jgi:hypothetical protein
VLAQVGPGLPDQLQQDIIRDSGQDGQVFVVAQAPQQRMESGNLGSVDSTSLMRMISLIEDGFFRQFDGNGLFLSHIPCPAFTPREILVSRLEARE